VLGITLGLARLLGYAPVRQLGVGSDDEPGGYVEDLCRWARTGHFASRDGSVDYGQRLRRVGLEVMAYSSAGDRLALADDCAELIRELPSAHPLRVVGRGWGDRADPDHFSLLTDERFV